MAAIIEVENLSKLSTAGRARYAALHEVSFEIQPEPLSLLWDLPGPAKPPC